VEGLYQGILISWRLVLLLHFGSLLAATTRIGRLQGHDDRPGCAFHSPGSR
jgi:hypothetical protein